MAVHRTDPQKGGEPEGDPDPRNRRSECPAKTPKPTPFTIWIGREKLACGDFRLVVHSGIVASEGLGQSGPRR